MAGFLISFLKLMHCYIFDQKSHILIKVNNEAAILSNQFGSVRYKNFLGGLGTFVKLTQVDPKFTYVAGLDLKGQDGSYTCSWQDDIMQGRLDSHRPS